MLEDGMFPGDLCLADLCKEHFLSRKTNGVFDKE